MLKNIFGVFTPHIGDNDQNLKNHYEEEDIVKHLRKLLISNIWKSFEDRKKRKCKEIPTTVHRCGRRAEKWFNFQETTGLTEFSDFKKRFKKKYYIEQEIEEKDEVRRRFAINRELRKFLCQNINEEKRYNDLRRLVKKDTQSPTERILSISAPIKNSRDCRPRANLTTEKYELVALIDTGTEVSLMKESVAKKLGKTKTSGECNVDIDYNGVKTTIKCLLMKDMEEDMILGVVEIRKLKLGSMIDNLENESNKEEEKSMIEKEIFIKATENGCNLSYEQQNTPRKIIRDNKIIFTDSNTDRCLDIQHAIELTQTPQQTEASLTVTMSDTRGIVLLPSLTKVIAKIAARRINCIVEEHGLLAKEQAGFRTLEDCTAQVDLCMRKTTEQIEAGGSESILPNKKVKREPNEPESFEIMENEVPIITEYVYLGEKAFGAMYYLLSRKDMPVFVKTLALKVKIQAILTFGAEVWGTSTARCKGIQRITNEHAESSLEIVQALITTIIDDVFASREVESRTKIGTWAAEYRLSAKPVWIKLVEPSISLETLSISASWGTNTDYSAHFVTIQMKRRQNTYSFTDRDGKSIGATIFYGGLLGLAKEAGSDELVCLYTNFGNSAIIEQSSTDSFVVSAARFLQRIIPLRKGIIRRIISVGEESPKFKAQ
ncbi:uncharacterized protein VNE69_12137 [Vairimorpha necatrix]|uniref:Peptidase A2 domain-containing protein n=1 Tax=Vairimorpha necatrix TaxID=6039 RepID=A0AAX4JGN6_9MICR